MRTSMAFQPVIVERLAKDLPMPHYATEGSAGVDLYAAVEKPVTICPGDRALVPTGLKIQLPKNHELQIRPKSGRSLNEGLSVLNTPGTIDEDYRGEIGVILINLGHDDIVINRGQKIAQGVVSPYIKAVFKEGVVDSTARGTGGFGSTGI